MNPQPQAEPDRYIIPDDWRDYHFQNNKLWRQLNNVAKLQADMDYVIWLMRLVRHDDHYRQSIVTRKDLKDIVVFLDPWPALWAARNIADNTYMKLDDRSGRFVAACDHQQLSPYSNTPIDIPAGTPLNELEIAFYQLSGDDSVRQKIADAYFKATVKVLKSKKWHKPKHVELPEATNNLLVDYEARKKSAKMLKQTAKRPLPTRAREHLGRTGDVWGSAFLLGLSDHLIKVSRKPHYRDCGNLLDLIREDGGIKKLPSGKPTAIKCASPKLRSIYPHSPKTSSPTTVRALTVNKLT